MSCCLYLLGFTGEEGVGGERWEIERMGDTGEEKRERGKEEIMGDER